METLFHGRLQASASAVKNSSSFKAVIWELPNGKLLARFVPETSTASGAQKELLMDGSHCGWLLGGVPRPSGPWGTSGCGEVHTSSACALCVSAFEAGCLKQAAQNNENLFLR